MLDDGKAVVVGVEEDAEETVDGHNRFQNTQSSCHDVGALVPFHGLVGFPLKQRNLWACEGHVVGEERMVAV